MHVFAKMHEKLISYIDEITLEGCYSEWGSVPSGVPQGVELEPFVLKTIYSSKQKYVNENA